MVYVRRVCGVSCRGTDDCICAFCKEDNTAMRAFRERSQAARSNLDGGDMLRRAGEPTGQAQEQHRESSQQANGVGASYRGLIGSSRMLCQESNGRGGPPSLVALCVGYLGQYLEELLEDVHLFAPAFPTPIKQAFFAIARRRGLLNDSLLDVLVDESWRLLDISGSAVTDAGLQHAADRCSRLEAVDLSGCDDISPAAVELLVERNPDLVTIRCGGTPASDAIARSSLRRIVPGLAHASAPAAEREESSWEEVDVEQVGRGAQALRWIVWPTIDEKSQRRLVTKCPKIQLNPKSSSRFKWPIPREAFDTCELDAPFVASIDSKTWMDQADWRLGDASLDGKDSDQVRPLAERFRLAYEARDERLAPKRAKNLRQRQRRAERAWLSKDENARARLMAGVLLKTQKMDI